VPIWGVQRTGELEELLGLENSPPALDAALWAAIERDRTELSGQFCRGCGYCLPCPAGIPIPFAARMAFLLRRAPAANFLTEQWQEQMRRIRDCELCRQCAGRCPYQLDTPALLQRMYDDYEAYLLQHPQ
jgi:predicted aldo/keto reductase-like oxidoreductase